MQLGWEYDRDSEDIPSTNESVTDDLFSVRAGLLYELQDKGRWRSYVLPHIAYDTRDFGDGGNASGFTAGLSVGGDVKVSRGLSLGLESGIQYSTFSNEFEGTSTGDSNKLWAGKYNRLNFTLRFPHDTSRDERGRAE